jgi:hypothetical protein
MPIHSGERKRGVRKCDPNAEQGCVLFVDQNAPAIAGLFEGLKQAKYRVAGPFSEYSDTFD